MSRYIVVGAGSAGMTAAWRLSADPGNDVVLLEAGPDASAPLPDSLQVSALQRGIPVDPQFLWDYSDADDGTPLIRGKLTGGCSAVNYAGATRGDRRSYDNWAVPGWSFADCLPSFRAIENDADFGDTEHHGSYGPIPVVRRPVQECDDPIAAAFAAAGHREKPDLNDAEHAVGYGPFPSNVLAGERASTAATMLPTLRERANVTVLTRCDVQRVEIRDGRAIGVHALVPGGNGLELIEADGIVLSAGVYGSPEVLFASGLGPADQLRAAGIHVACDLPELGQNLIDHPMVLINVEAEEAALPSPMGNPLLLCLELAGGAHSAAHVFAQRGLIPGMPPTTVSVVCALLSPVGRGYLELGRGRRAAVHRRMLPAGEDRAQMRDLVDRAGAIVDELIGNHAVSLLSDAAWRTGSYQTLLDSAVTYNHPVGTCRMGVDEGSVVDTQLRVRGVAGLRVADASIMPCIPRSQTNLPSMMIGHRAAELMLRG